MNQKISKEGRADQFRRIDSWLNTITNLGMKNKDKRTGARVAECFLKQREVEAIYQSDDIAARIIDRIPEEMTREGFKIIIDQDKDNLADRLQTELDRFEIENKIEQAMKMARLYGGAVLFFGVNDGKKPEEPLDLKAIRSIRYVVVLDRYSLNPADIQADVTKENFGFPETYNLVVTDAPVNNQKIHHTRLVRFDGVDLPYRMRIKNQYWGDSVFSRLYNVIRNFQTSHDSAATILQDFSVGIFKMKALDDLLAQGKDGERILSERLALVALLSSIVNAIVLREDEDYEKKTTNVAGLPEMLKMVNMRLVAATDIPHTILLGESPSGLGATGDSEKLDWFDQIKNKQESILRPAILKIINIFLSAREGVSKGQVPEKVDIEFNSLWQMDEKEMIEIRKTQAEIDQIYIANGVLDPEEVTDSRFGSGIYSHETTINQELRKNTENNPPAPDEPA